jgi:hypothetical protein
MTTSPFPSLSHPSLPAGGPEDSGYERFPAGETPLGTMLRKHAENEWRPPILTVATDDPPPFPIESAFPSGLEFFRDYVASVAENRQCPIDMPFLLALAAVGLASSHKFHVAVSADKEWKETPNLYVAVVMEPGSKKSSIVREILHPIFKWESAKDIEMRPTVAAAQSDLAIKRKRLGMLQEIASGKKTPQSGEKFSNPLDEARQTAEEIDLFEQMMPVAPRLITTEPTPEAVVDLLKRHGGHIGIFGDEAGAVDVLMGRYSNEPNCGVYNNAYDGGSVRVNRVNKDRPETIVDSPLLSIGLLIQPEAILEFVQNRKTKGLGLVPRFILCSPKGNVGYRKISSEVGGVCLSARARFREAMTFLLNIQSSEEDREIVLSRDAAVVLAQLERRTEEAQRKGGLLADDGDFGSKFTGKIIRLALDFHILKWASSRINPASHEIQESTLVAAVSLFEYLAGHYLQVTGSSTRAGSLQQRLLEWIIEKPHLTEFTYREASRTFRGAVKEELEGALADIEDRGVIRFMPTKRSSKLYEVNPKIRKAA